MDISVLKRKALNGIGWSAFDNILKYFVNFIISIILARLLSPGDYGIIGLISIFTSISTAIIEGGFSSALIRKNDTTDNDYNTVFIINLLMSILFYIILYSTAPFISNFFNQPKLTLITRVMSLNLIIGAMAMTQSVKLTKRLDFKSQAKITFCASVLGGIIGVIMAYMGYGPWAIVGQSIILHLVKTILLWFVNKWIPKLVFSKRSFHELFGFGWKLLMSILIDTGWKEIYQVVIGKCYTPEVLGQYTRAKGFAALFSTNLTSVISRVSYPTFSQIQDNKIQLKHVYKKTIRITMYITFALMLGLAAISKNMVIVLVGSKWLPCVPFLQILCLQMMLYPLHALNLNMLQVLGRSDLFLKIEIIKKFIAIFPLILGIFVGIYWMLFGSVITGLIGYYLNSYFSGKYINYPTREQIQDILPSLVISIIMAFVVLLINYLKISSLILLIIQILIGVVVFIVFSIIAKLQEFKDIKNLIYSKIIK